MSRRPPGGIFDIGLRAGLPDADQMQAVEIGLSVTPEPRRTHYVSGFAFPCSTRT